VLDAGAEHEQLIEALLTLAQSQRGIEHRETFDLAPIVEEAIEPFRRRAAERAVTIDVSVTAASAAGDPRLVGRLASNLLENAVRYNVRDGSIRVRLDPGPDHAMLTIANTGPRVPADQIGRLTQPFQRLAPDRTAEAQGHGLGLSIVAAITAAHGADLGIRPNPDGGLLVAVAFPAPSPCGAQDSARQLGRRNR
jgi:signal transduction histidine kinase